MSVADSKRFQSCMNMFFKKVSNPVIMANGVAGLIRQAMIDNNLQSNLTQAERTALQQFVNDLSNLASSPVITKMAGLYVPTHSDNDVTIEGVNG